ncbi:MAG: WecB/TagA/CpsF family glycosyltransferase [Clostridia bacterium]
MELKEIRILGLKVHHVDMEQSLVFLDEALSGNDFTRVITLNAEIAYGAYGNEELTSLINGADLVTPDGSGILWAASRYGTPLTERVCGIDLLTALMEKYNDGSKGFYFLGAKPEVAEKAAEKIREQYPKLRYCGYHDGYFGKENSEAMADIIAKSGADILIAAMGAPFQDRWIAQYGSRCGVKVGIGVGGSLDVISGTVKRAPVLFQKMRLEWLYRLLTDFSRWKRMTVLPKFMRLVKKQCKS